MNQIYRAMAFYFLFLPFQLFSQAVSVDVILESGITKVDRVDVSNLPFFQKALAFGFDDSGIDQPALIRQLKGLAIYQVDLVYSSHRDSPSFSQVELNRSRLEGLQAVMPDLFEQTAIVWRLVEQTEDRSKPTAEALFHGFIFHFRVGSFATASGRLTTMRSSAEMDALHSWFGDTLPGNYVPTLAIPLTVLCDTIQDTVLHIHRKPYLTGKYMPRWKSRRIKGIRYDKPGWVFKRRKEMKYLPDSTYTYEEDIDCGHSRFSSPFGYFAYGWDAWTTSSFRDSVVISTFNRHREWKNVLVVEDVTGSMYPYTGQTILWRRLNDSLTHIDDYAFFNDGDMRPDGPIGKSGGVYASIGQDVPAMERRASEAMRNGGGGGIPENNLEAILKGLGSMKVKPERVILIADNLANIRDYSLLPKVLEQNVPVDVIVCGAFEGYVNNMYLNLALATKGNVYTMEQELTDLVNLAEDKIITIGKAKFKVKEGKFVRVG